MNALLACDDDDTFTGSALAGYILLLPFLLIFWSIVFALIYIAWGFLHG